MSFEALKARQSDAWGSAPWEPMAARLAGIHDHLVARLAPGRGERWLDVGTGTGAVALRAARARARVTGVDLSPVMIDTARRLADAQGVGIEFDVGDAEASPTKTRASMSSPPRSGSSSLPSTPRPAGEPDAGDRRDWGRGEYVAELLGHEFELEFDEGELRPTAGSGEEMWRIFTSFDGAAKAQVDSLGPRRAEEYAARTSTTTSATARTAVSTCRAATWSRSAVGAGPAA